GARGALGGAGARGALVPTPRALSAPGGGGPLAAPPRWARRRAGATRPSAMAAALRRAPSDPSALAVLWGPAGVGKTTFARSALGERLELDATLARAALGPGFPPPPAQPRPAAP